MPSQARKLMRICGYIDAKAGAPMDADDVLRNVALSGIGTGVEAELVLGRREAVLEYWLAYLKTQNGKAIA